MKEEGGGRVEGGRVQEGVRLCICAYVQMCSAALCILLGCPMQMHI